VVVITDDDNITDTVEDAGPNSGDANNDGAKDSLQSSVASAVNPSVSISGSSDGYTALALDTTGTTCNSISNLSFASESSLTTQDTGYDYPVGLIDFMVTCSSSGDAAAITYILDQEYDTSNWTWRKYNATTNTYRDITSQVTFGTVTVDGKVKTNVMLSIADGSSLDDDGLVNGVIIDPAGPAVLAATETGTEELSNTGSQIYATILAGTTLAGSAVVLAKKTRAYKKYSLR
jgi:hypothetical protein